MPDEFVTVLRGLSLEVRRIVIGGEPLRSDRASHAGAVSGGQALTLFSRTASQAMWRRRFGSNSTPRA